MDAIDERALQKYSLRVWSYKQGEMVSAMIHVGDRLGLYEAMDGAGPITADALAASAGYHARFVLEWLRLHAAAGLVIRHDDETFELPPEGAAVLAQEHDHPAFSAGAFHGGLTPAQLDAIESSFRTGRGITYEAHGPRAAAAMARMTAPSNRHGLVPVLIPRIDGLVDVLRNGGSVVDVGCGGGVTTCEVAAAFPGARVVGYTRRRARSPSPGPGPRRPGSTTCRSSSPAVKTCRSARATTWP